MDAQRLVFDGRLTYPPQRSLGAFLVKNPPSRVPLTEESCLFVYSRDAKRDSDEADVDGMDLAWEALLDSQVKPTAAQVQELALRYRMVSGKWMLFIRRSDIDAVWNRIAAATVHGQLGCSANVLPMDPPPPGNPRYKPSHLICVNVDDFTDLPEVWRVREALRIMGHTRNISFKPDAYTHLDIFSGNEWEIQPSIYYG